MLITGESNSTPHVALHVMLSIAPCELRIQYQAARSAICLSEQDMLHNTLQGHARDGRRHKAGAFCKQLAMVYFNKLDGKSFVVQAEIY